MPYLAATCTPIELTKLRTSETLIAMARKLLDAVRYGAHQSWRTKKMTAMSCPHRSWKSSPACTEDERGRVKRGDTSAFLGIGRAWHTWSDEREEAGEKDGARRLHKRPVECPRVQRLMQEGEGGGERRRLLVANRLSRDEEERGVQDGDADPVEGDGEHGRWLLGCASIPIRA